jgi:UDP-N-acetylglucosamine transferase subunit ALG13
LIFVTVGTELPFDRLVMAVDALCAAGTLGDVFMQIGASGRVPTRARYVRLIPYQDMEQAVRDSDLVVAHAGPGSISLARTWGKKPLIMPRRPELGEVVDEHQLLLAARLSGLGLANVVLDAHELEGAISRILYTSDTTVPATEQEELGATVAALDSLVERVTFRVPLRRKLWDHRRTPRRV